MFPSAKIRFASAARRGFDLAIEFATLGEYAVAPAVRPRRQGSVPRPAEDGVMLSRPRPTRLKPATAAARRLQPALQARRISTRSAVRALAFAGWVPSPPRRA